MTDKEPTKSQAVREMAKDHPEDQDTKSPVDLILKKAQEKKLESDEIAALQRACTISERRTTQIGYYQHQGSLPDPQHFEGYKKVDPKLPDRIVAMAENEQKMSFDLQKRALELEDKKVQNQARFNVDTIKQRGKGQWMAFALAMALIFLSGLALFVNPWISAVIAGVNVAGIATAMITGRVGQQKSESRLLGAIKKISEKSTNSENI